MLLLFHSIILLYASEERTLFVQVETKIKLICPDYQLIEISVTKDNPPLGQLAGHSTVKLSVSKD